MMKHIALALSAFTVSLFLVAKPVAAETCTTNYGGTTVCTPNDLLINKQVKNPISGIFVENLSSGDATYSPGSEVLFRLTIRNTSGETFNPVVVKDTFPDYMTFVSGPGTYDSGSRTLTFELTNLVAGETRTVEILAKFENRTMPYDVFCVTNWAKATAAARPEGDDDTADLCVTSKVLGVTTLPAAGFNDFLVLLPFAGIGLMGIALLRKTK